MFILWIQGNTWRKEMIVEWECILECNYKCSYCTNGHNGVLDKPIKCEKDKEKVFDFLDSLKENYPEDELFLFGGEPFLHPFINEIISYMLSNDIKFMVQTNFSLYEKIKNITDIYEFPLQISVHPSEIKDEDSYIKAIEEQQKIIRRIDVMYIGKESIELYKKILKVLDDSSILYLCPLADFNIVDGVHNPILYEYNELRNSTYGKIYHFEQGERSFIWEQMMRGEISCKNKPCMYKDQYVLFDPMLDKYSCNYRQNNDICPHDHCFLM